MMVKDDSLYIVAIVAVVAVVGLVIMATGSTVVAEDLPSMVDSDDAAIAGQAMYNINDAPGVTIAAGGLVDYTETASDGAVKLHDRGYRINTASDDAAGFAARSSGELAAMSSEELASLTSDQLSALSLDRLIAIIQAFQSQTKYDSFDFDTETRR